MVLGRMEGSGKTEWTAAYGWALRFDKTYLLLLEESGELCAIDPHQSEAYAMLNGLKGVKSLGLRKLLIWTDSTELIKGLQDCKQASTFIKPII